MTAETRIEAFDIVISGAGIGALTLANYLAPLGFRILILDRRPGFDPVYRGELVQPLGLSILEELSLLDELLACPHTLYRSFDFLDERGRLLMRSSYERGEAPFPYALAIEPHQMDQILAKNLSSFPHVVLRHESDFTGYTVDRGGAIATYERGGETRQVLARVIIGDDGRHSRIRELSKLTGTVAPYQDSYLGASLLLPEDASRLPEPVRDTAGRYFIGPRSIFFFFSVSERRRFFLLLLPDRNQETFFAGGIDKVLAMLDRQVPGFADLARLNGVDSPETLVELPVWKVDLDQWCTDGVILIGDAAHAMNPHVAQGRNQAMEDARVLAPILSKALLSGSLVLRDSMVEYEKKRLPVTRALHRLADEMTLVWNTGNPFIVKVREATFRGIGRIPALERKIVTTISGMKVTPLTSLDKLRALGTGLISRS